MATGRIEGLFRMADGQRAGIMRDARLCAALTKPWVLPPQGQSDNQPLPETYQSLGIRGVTNLEGKILVGIFPPDVPWYQLTPSPKVAYDPSIPAEVLQEIEQTLFVHELIIQSILESAYLDDTGDDRDVAGFRTTMRQAIGDVLITGDTLVHLGDDYRLTRFARTHYVVKRDKQGRVLYIVVWESVDASELTDQQKSASSLPTGTFTKDNPSDRLVDLWTAVEWQPATKTWTITQEINGRKVASKDEKINPYFSVPFDLSEDYGRGFVEHNRGDLRSFNGLREKQLEWAATASKHLLVKDYSSLTRDEDFAKESGSVILGRVSGGALQDAALLKADKLADFTVVRQVAQDIRQDLGAAMLLESETVRDSERTTAYEIAEITIRELEGALGGFYAPMADRFQVPLLRRTVFQLRRDNLLPTLPKGLVQMRALTGIAALVREKKAMGLLSLADVANKLGPEAAAKVNSDVLLDVYARYRRIYEPGLIKTNAQSRAELEQAMMMQARQQAMQKAIDVGGNVAENNLTNAAQSPQTATA